MKMLNNRFFSAALIFFSISACVLFSQDMPVKSEEGSIKVPAKDSTDEKFYDNPDASGETTGPEKTDDSGKTENRDTSIPFIFKPSKLQDESANANMNARVYSDGLNTFINSYVRFSLSTSDNIIHDKVFYKIDSDAFAEYKSQFNITAEGKHTIAYYSVDRMGNRERGEKEFTVIVDNTPPEISVSPNMPTVYGRLYATKDLLLQASAKDSLSGAGQIEYSINGGPYQSYFTPFGFPADTTGTEYLAVKFRCMDRVGNKTESFTFHTSDISGKKSDANVNTIPFYIDRRPPTVKISASKEFIYRAGMKITTADNSYTVTAEDKESGIDKIHYRVDSQGDFILYKGAITLNTNGLHKIEACAEDKSGNMSQLAEIEVYVDRKPPVTNIKIINSN